MDHLKVSATLYTTWKRCPAQALARLDGHYPPDTIGTFRGLLAHRIFARHYREGKISVVDFTQACREEIGKSNLNWKIRDLGLTPRDVNGVILVVSDLYRRFLTAARNYPIRPENTEIHVEAALTDEITLVGRIDAEHNGTLIDWKTGELGDNVSDQLRFYALVWWLTRGMPLSVEAVSVATGEKHAEWVDHKTLIDTELDVIEMVADLTTATGPETPGPYCQWCPILDGCKPGTRTLALLG